jgi:FAD/FMN-containing dehydrogenase
MTIRGQEPTRRAFLGGAAAAAVAAWAPFRVPAADAATRPPGFPRGLNLQRQAYENWAGQIVVDDLWTCTPRRPADVVALVNWAAERGWRVRPRGRMHGWSPLLVAPGTPSSARIVLADTTKHLTGLRMVGDDAVRVGAGATMDALMAFDARRGLGFTTTPAPGDITVGGALAIGAHGAALPAAGEARRRGHTFGSLGNLVLALTIVAYDRRRQRYELRTVQRDDPDCAALLTHLGRVFVVEAVLRAGEDTRLRCQSFTDIPATELFAAPGDGGRTFASFLEASGRAESIWFPFTDTPWLKVWTPAPTQPVGSRAVTAPYNYSFSDHISESDSESLRAGLLANPSSTPGFGAVAFQAVAAGLTSDGSNDLWGASKDVLLYIRPTTLRVTANGYAILVPRRDVQQAVHELAEFFSQQLAEHAARGEFPINGPMEIRCTGLDDPADCGVPGARIPALSPLTPAGAGDADVAIWLDLLTFPGTPGSEAFLRDFERFIFARFPGRARPEWSKGWAYTATDAWAAPSVLRRTIPALYPAWNATRTTYARLDPAGVVTAPLVKRLLG